MGDRLDKDVLTMISAYEHGQNAARHGKYIQACPFVDGSIFLRPHLDTHLGSGRLSRTCKYCAWSSGVTGIERAAVTRSFEYFWNSLFVGIGIWCFPDFRGGELRPWC
jgi:hypothetical protein